jgi:tetratricopeptide (TPR) repeat protein
MIPAVLLLCLFLQTNVTDASVNRQVAPLLESGLDAEARGNLGEAIAAFRKAADLAPSDAVVFFRLGEAYMKKRDYAAAIPPLRRAAELRPDSLPVHQLLGFALLAEGYASEAIPHLEEVHEYAALGIAQLQANHPAEAVQNLESALEKTPNDADLLYYLGRAASALSVESVDKLLADFPQTARGHQALGQSYYAAKMYPQAVKEYEQALALRPDLPGLRLELGQIYAATSDWDKAETEFREESKLQPGNPEAAYRLGQVLLEEGKMEEAARELRRSDQLRPDMPETLYSLGKAQALSDPPAAERALTRVIQLEKETPLAGQAYLALAGVHRKQGKREDAARDMDEFRRIQALASHLPE